MSDDAKRGEELWAAMNDEELPERYDEAPDSKTAFEKLMERASSKGPNKSKAKEFLAQDDAEPTEAAAETTGTLIGTMSSGTTAAASVHHSAYPTGIGTSTSGHSTVVPGGGMKWGVPTTTTPVWAPAPTMPTHTPAAKPAKSVEQVPMPPKFTPKVLIAFMEEQGGEMEDKLVWAAHLLAEHFEMRLEDGEIRLVMEFSLRDHYGNNPSTED